MINSINNFSVPRGIVLNPRKRCASEALDLSTTKIGLEKIQSSVNTMQKVKSIAPDSSAGNLSVRPVPIKIPLSANQPKASCFLTENLSVRPVPIKIPLSANQPKASCFLTENLSVRPVPIRVSLATKDKENSGQRKRVEFCKMVSSVILIPTRKELTEEGLNNVLWWNSCDYDLFKAAVATGCSE